MMNQVIELDIAIEVEKDRDLEIVSIIYLFKEIFFFQNEKSIIFIVVVVRLFHWEKKNGRVELIWCIQREEEWEALKVTFYLPIKIALIKLKLITWIALLITKL